MAENELLRQKIDALIKLLYGVKSEKIDPAQLQLLLEGLMPEKPLAPSSEETSAPEGAAKPKPANKKDKAENNSRLKGFDTLEVVEVTIYPDDYEDQKDQLEYMGREVTEQLDYQPAKLVKLRTIRPKFRNKADRAQPPLLAPAPAAPLSSGTPTFSLTAQLIVSKYADHLPIYRLH